MCMGAYEMCDTWIEFNSELIKLVCVCTLFHFNFQITDCASHFRGEVKMRVFHLVAPMYSIKGGNDNKVIVHNVRLAHELKANSLFVYLCVVIYYLRTLIY